MEPARPTLPERPCPVCGNAVEPLRAGAVVLLTDGFRFFCDSDCRRRFAMGERDHEASRAPSTRPSLSRKRAPTPAPPMPRPRTSPDRSAAYRALDEPGDPPPWLGLGTALSGAVFGAFATHPILALLSVLAVASAASYALFRGWATRPRVGWLAWALPPLGALLAALSALLLRGPESDPRLWLVGASAAAATVVVRTWLDARSIAPVDQVVRLLESKMPARLRVPRKAREWSTEVAWDEVPAAQVRAGQEILVGEGEVVGVDGVVQAGAAQALLHPASRTPVRRLPGDPMLAGAVVTEGEVRILATRVGAERALVRPKAFQDIRGEGLVAQIASRTLVWGGPAALVLAAAGALFGTGEGLAMQVAAAAAVLLAAPLVAVRRAIEGPYVAAAATAAERGIAFADARALDRAGRTSVAALCTHGTITEGEPEVVQIHGIGDVSWESVIALVAGAEDAAAEDHPIARAVHRFCERRGIEPVPVRRAAFVQGRGVTAQTATGEELVVGNRGLLLSRGVSVAVADGEAARDEERGHTVLFVGLDGRVRAVISLRDEERLGARAAVQRLMDLSIEVVLISGDHRGTVEALARPLDVTHVKAELLPEERGEGVKHLRETSGLVATIGHPLFDEAPLEAADVPVVLGAAGAVEGERGVSLTGDDVRDAAAALWLARAARRASWRGTLVAGLGGGLLLAMAVAGVAAPVVVALLALGVDAYVLPSAARLLRRIELRLPARG